MLQVKNQSKITSSELIPPLSWTPDWPCGSPSRTTIVIIVLRLIAATIVILVIIVIIANIIVVVIIIMIGIGL